jgi:hypothetical protein
MEANATLQMVLLGVLPFIMQGLKQIPWVEAQKRWLCPLLCIGAGVLGAYLLNLREAMQNWVLIGILTGMAANKLYDFGSDIKGAVGTLSGPAGGAGVGMILLLCMVLLFGGCSPAMQADGKAQYVVAAKSFAASVQQLTAMQKAGVFTPAETADLDKLIHAGKDILAEWKLALASDQPAPGSSQHLADIMDKLLDYELKQGGGL